MIETVEDGGNGNHVTDGLLIRDSQSVNSFGKVSVLVLRPRDPAPSRIHGSP